MVVVLTGMMDLNAARMDTPEFSDSVDRILAGIEMVRSGRAAILMISGGSGDLFDQSQKEAPLLSEFAEWCGLSEDQIVIESASRNTYENALYSAELIQQQGWKRVLLVTSAFHMRRAAACFRKQMIDADLLPVDY